MFHAFGLFVTSLPTLHAGGKIVTLPSFEPNSFLKAVENTKVSTDGDEHLKIQKKKFFWNKNVTDFIKASKSYIKTLLKAKTL